MVCNYLGIILALQTFPIPQTSNWSGTFFAASYSKPALMSHAYLCGKSLIADEPVDFPNCFSSKFDIIAGQFSWFVNQNDIRIDCDRNMRKSQC